MSSLEKVHCIYPVPVAHKDDHKNSSLSDEEFFEQMKDFIKYILNDNDDDSDKSLVF